jgi:hypothetical protein
VLHLRSIDLTLTGFSTPRQPGLCGLKTTKCVQTNKKHHLIIDIYTGIFFSSCSDILVLRNAAFPPYGFCTARRDESSRIAGHFSRAVSPDEPGGRRKLKPGDSAMRDAKTQTLTQDAQRIAALTGSVVLLVVVLLITTHGGAAAPV